MNAIQSIDDVAVSIDNVSLSYRRMRTPASSIRQLAGNVLQRRFGFVEHPALRNVTLRVRRGETIGVVGANGAGKSTLMRAVAGVLPPTTGRIITRGQIAPLIDLGAGFDADLTGRENIVLSGSLLGRDPRAMQRAVRRIAEWAGVAEDLDVPLKMYSSGMLARLAFAIAVDCDPDVLLVDEALAVGDENFQARSAERMRELVSGGTAAIIVSHALDMMVAMCDRILWLDHGHSVACGNSATVVAAYRSRAAEVELMRVDSNVNRMSA